MIPVIEAARRGPELTARGVRISIDTVKPAVAEAAVAAGATLVNDVSASLWRGRGRPGVRLGGDAHAGRRRATMQDDPRYDDVVAEVHVLPARPGPSRPARPAWTRSGSTRASGSARRPSTTSRCCATCAELVDAAADGRVRRRARRHQPQAVPRRARAAPGAPSPGRPPRRSRTASAGSLATAAAAHGRGCRHGPGPRRGGHGRRRRPAVWSAWDAA